MRAIKWVIGLAGLYAVFVLVFEGVYLGLMQPSFEEAERQGSHRLKGAREGIVASR